MRRPGLVLAATILASSLDFIDGSVVNVAALIGGALAARGAALLAAFRFAAICGALTALAAAAAIVFLFVPAHTDATAAPKGD